MTKERIDYMKSYYISCTSDIYHAGKSSIDLLKHILIIHTLLHLTFGDVTKEPGQNSPNNKAFTSHNTVV